MITLAQDTMLSMTWQALSVRPYHLLRVHGVQAKQHEEVIASEPDLVGGVEATGKQLRRQARGPEQRQQACGVPAYQLHGGWEATDRRRDGGGAPAILAAAAATDE